MRFPYGKVVVITGASAGIGKACAEMFARKGYHVWALSRRAQGARKNVGDGYIVSMTCDVRDEASVRAVADRVLKEEGEIGTLVQCAGIGVAGPIEQIPLKDARDQFDTNYFGVVQVNSVFLPLLRQRGGGMDVIVGSVGGVLTLPFQGHYSASKFALEALTEALRIEGKAHGLRACVIEPGDTKTEFTGQRKVICAEDSPYVKGCRHGIARQSHDEQHGVPPEKVAKAALRVAGKKHPPVRRAVGLSYKTLIMLKRLVPAKFTEMILRKMYVGKQR